MVMMEADDGEPRPALELQPDDNGRVFHGDASRSLLRLHHLATLEDTRELLVYNPLSGLYSPGENLIASEIEEAAQYQGLANSVGSHFVREVIQQLRRSTFTPRSAFNAEPGLIPLRLGVLDLATRELREHSPYHRFTFGLALGYDKEATCPAIDKFFAEIVREEHIPLLYELFGWCLDTRSPLQRLALLVGEGANGKSTLVSLLQRFLGEGNCSHVTLQDLANNRFSSSELYGKLANVFSDLPASVLKDVGTLKALTGGDAISAEKKFKDRFSFQNTAKLIFSANRPPLITEDSVAIWRRLVLVDFPNAFLGEMADKGLLDRLAAPRELSGLLNRALDGLDRLKGNGDFSYRMTPAEVRAQYRRLSDNVVVFLEEMCELDAEGVTSKEELYSGYERWCKEKHLTPATKKAFGIRMSAIDIYSITTGRKQGERVWLGVKLKKWGPQ